MVVSFKTNSDITLESHDFSKRQWRKICRALGAQDDFYEDEHIQILKSLTDSNVFYYMLKHVPV